MKTLLLLAACLICSGTAAAREWHFKAMLDGREIGYHRFALAERDGHRELVSEARFNVRILGLNAYRYAHDALERWRGDCLTGIEARTDDDGRRLSVKQAPEKCVMSFAYWNPAMLRQTQLLNAQTGELMDVKISAAGEEALDIRGAPVAARRYRLEARGMTIDLWYSLQGEWLALDSLVSGGKRLRYRPS